MKYDAAGPIDRWPALLGLMIAGIPLTIAANLDASAYGIGTHTQLGLEPCAFEMNTGLPCATCGMTTTFTHVAHGNLLQGFINQPAGFVLALIAAMTVVVCGWSLYTGMRLAPIGQALMRPRLWILGIVILAASWIYKIATHVEII